MKFDGLNHKASELAVEYLTWIAGLDEDELNAEAERLNEVDIGPVSMLERDAAETDVLFLTSYVTHYLDADEAGRMVEQDRLEAINCGSDQTYIVAKNLTSINRNFCHCWLDMRQLMKDHYSATEDELSTIRSLIACGVNDQENVWTAIDNLTAAVTAVVRALYDE